MKSSQIGRYLDELLETVINGTPPRGPRRRVVSRLADEVCSSECRAKRVVTFGGGTGLSTVLGGNSQLDDWPDNPFIGLK